jgi:hypothetical protein
LGSIGNFELNDKLVNNQRQTFKTSGETGKVLGKIGFYWDCLGNIGQHRDLLVKAAFSITD